MSLWVFVVGFGVLSANPSGPERLQESADLVSGMAWPFAISWWVVADARKRGRKLCYDFGSFVFLAAPFVVPFYLIQTRGLRALLTLLWFGVMLAIAGIVLLILTIASGNF